MVDSHLHHPNRNQWADLSKDILFRIINYLDLKTDLPRVRGVCPSWRSALPLADFPMNKSHIAVPSLDEGAGDTPPLFLHETRIYLFSPLRSSADDNDESNDCNTNKSWIARMFEIGMNKWHLINPLGNYHCEYLITDPPIVGAINLLDCQILELARPMSLVHELDYNGQPISKKVVGEWDFVSGNLSVVLVLLVKEKGGGLLMLKSDDQEWFKIHGTSKHENLENVSFVVDIAFHKGNFYFLEMIDFGEWRVGMINPSDCSISMQYKNGFSRIYRPGGYLVSSQLNDCVYLLLNESEYLTRSRLVKVIFDNKEQENYEDEWKPVENLGNEILFVGNYVSFALKNSALNHFAQWNSISMCLFSSGHSLDLQTWQLPQTEGGVRLKQVKYLSCCDYLLYLVMNKGVLQRYVQADDQKEVQSRLFFPPPVWVKWCCPSFDNVGVKLNDLPFEFSRYYDDSDHYYGDSDINYCCSD